MVVVGSRVVVGDYASYGAAERARDAVEQLQRVEGAIVSAIGG